MLYMSTLRMTVQRVDVIRCFIAVIQLEFRNINFYSKTSAANGRKKLHTPYRKKNRNYFFS